MVEQVKITIEQFDSLKSGKNGSVVKLGFSGCYGGIVPQDFQISRKTHSHKYGVTKLKLTPVGTAEKPANRMGTVTIYKRANQEFASVAWGDMGVIVKHFEIVK